MSFESLPEISMEQVDAIDSPTTRIRTEEDLMTWRTTKGYQHYLLFLHRLSDSVAGFDVPENAEARNSWSPAIKASLAMLDQLDSWIDEIPPLNTPQRFGNLAFRTWGKRLEDNVDNILQALLPERFHTCIRLLKPYLIISFGSFTRMDYGTGHESAFATFLLCLSLVRFFQAEPKEERNVVLIVFLRYMRLCWKLQDVYKLEPAGSHGVWGLDDSSFLGYIFGSAQLKDRSDIPVSSVLRLPLPSTNLYYLSISRIHEVKSGPFHEHSSQLYAIATSVPNWAKVNSGLFKMYEAEVLGKRVVVQHIPVGGLLEWDAEMPPSLPPPSTVTTRAPWSSQHPISSTNFHTPGRSSGVWTSTSISSRPVDRTMFPPTPPAMNPKSPASSS